MKTSGWKTSTSWHSQELRAEDADLELMFSLSFCRIQHSGFLSKLASGMCFFVAVPILFVRYYSSIQWRTAGMEVLQHRKLCIIAALQIPEKHRWGNLQIIKGTFKCEWNEACWNGLSGGLMEVSCFKGQRSLQGLCSVLGKCYLGFWWNSRNNLQPLDFSLGTHQSQRWRVHSHQTVWLHRTSLTPTWTKISHVTCRREASLEFWRGGAEPKVLLWPYRPVSDWF